MSSQAVYINPMKELKWETKIINGREYQSYKLDKKPRKIVKLPQAEKSYWWFFHTNNEKDSRYDPFRGDYWKQQIQQFRSSIKDKCVH